MTARWRIRTSKHTRQKNLAHPENCDAQQGDNPAQLEATDHSALNGDFRWVNALAVKRLEILRLCQTASWAAFFCRSVLL